jgi:hypothetical protein
VNRRGREESIQSEPAAPTGRFREHLGFYEALVLHAEEGYDLTIYDYTNELGHRHILQDLLAAGVTPDAELLVRLEQLDERLRALLVPIPECIHGEYPQEYFWYHGLPRNATGALLEDARSMGWMA